jgi:hypothetical protein
MQAVTEEDTSTDKGAENDGPPLNKKYSKLAEVDINEMVEEEKTNIANFADSMATQLAIETAQQSQTLDKKGKEKLLDKFKKKKEVLKKYMQSAPFTRMQDKFFFMYGVLQVIFTSWLFGRYPHDVFYKYHTFVLSCKLVFKWWLYKQKGWHYYMTEFCYTAALVHLVYLNFFPKNENLFFTAFLFSNGALALAVGALKNQLVFHSIDQMSSLALHLMP